MSKTIRANLALGTTNLIAGGKVNNKTAYTTVVLDERSMTLKSSLTTKVQIPYSSISNIESKNLLTSFSGQATIHTYDRKSFFLMGFSRSNIQLIKNVVSVGYYSDSMSSDSDSDENDGNDYLNTSNSDTVDTSEVRAAQLQKDAAEYQYKLEKEKIAAEERKEKKRESAEEKKRKIQEWDDIVNFDYSNADSASIVQNLNKVSTQVESFLHTDNLNDTQKAKFKTLISKFEYGLTMLKVKDATNPMIEYLSRNYDGWLLSIKKKKRKTVILWVAIMGGSILAMIIGFSA